MYSLMSIHPMIDATYFKGSNSTLENPQKNETLQSQLCFGGFFDFGDLLFSKAFKHCRLE